MACFIPRHQLKPFGQHRVFALQFPRQFLVKQEARKLSGAGALQKLNEQLAGFAVNVIPALVELLIAHEVVAVIVHPKFFDDCLEFLFVGRDIHRRHFFEVGGVKARREDCVLGGNFDSRLDGLRFLGSANHELLSAIEVRVGRMTEPDRIWIDLTGAI